MQAHLAITSNAIYFYVNTVGFTFLVPVLL